MTDLFFNVSKSIVIQYGTPISSALAYLLPTLPLLSYTELKSDFIEKMKRIEKQKSIRVGNFAKRYGLV